VTGEVTATGVPEPIVPDAVQPAAPVDSDEPTSARRSLEAPHRRSGGMPRPIERAAVLSYRMAAWIIRHLPPRLSRTVLGWAFQASYLLWPSKRRWSNMNFGHVLRLPPRDPAVRRLALSAYRSYARYLVELMRLPDQPTRDMASQIDVVGIEALDVYWRGTDRGLIFVAQHVGNNEAVAVALADHGLPVSVVADDSSLPELFELLRRQREAWGVQLIPWRNLREIYRVLKRKEILGLIVDWGYRPDGIPVRLFDAWTCLPAGPAVLAAKTGAWILPVVVRRQSDGRFFVTHDEPIQVASTDEAEVQRATQALAAALERTIAAAPDQWYNFKPIWPETDAEMADLAARAARTAAAA